MIEPQGVLLPMPIFDLWVVNTKKSKVNDQIDLKNKKEDNSSLFRPLLFSATAIRVAGTVLSGRDGSRTAKETRSGLPEWWMDRCLDGSLRTEPNISHWSG